MLAGCIPDVSPNMLSAGTWARNTCPQTHRLHEQRRAAASSFLPLWRSSTRPRRWKVQGQIFGFQAKDVEPANCPPFQEESTSDIEMPQHRQALLWRAVLFLEASRRASTHMQALRRQPAVRDGVEDRITYDRKTRLKTKGRGSVQAKCLISIRI